jgi:hypothetical protein
MGCWRVIVPDTSDSLIAGWNFFPWVTPRLGFHNKHGTTLADLQPSTVALLPAAAMPQAHPPRREHDRPFQAVLRRVLAHWRAMTSKVPHARAAVATQQIVPGRMIPPHACAGLAGPTPALPVAQERATAGGAVLLVVGLVVGVSFAVKDGLALAILEWCQEATYAGASPRARGTDRDSDCRHFAALQHPLSSWARCSWRRGP